MDRKPSTTRTYSCYHISEIITLSMQHLAQFA